MMGKGVWDYMKDKQVYFVEYNDTIIKFNGYDDLEKWVKNLKGNEDCVVNCVAAFWRMKKR